MCGLLYSFLFLCGWRRRSEEPDHHFSAGSFGAEMKRAAALGSRPVRGTMAAADVSLDLELPDVSLEQQTTVELPYEAAMPPELQPVASAEHTGFVSAHTLKSLHGVLTIFI